MLLICTHIIEPKTHIKMKMKKSAPRQLLVMLVLIFICSVAISFSQEPIEQQQYVASLTMKATTIETNLDNNKALAMADALLVGRKTLSAASHGTYSLLVVEYETEMEVEAWMLSSFEMNTKYNQIQQDLKPDAEEELELEKWMTNLNDW
jgi:hypothetical protein